MDINDLLTKGYFPEEIIPTFTSEDLALVKDTILLHLAAWDPLTGNHKKTTKMTNFSVPKIKGYRRTLGIPHPLHYVRLCDTIVNNWADIDIYCQASAVSLSPIRIKAGSLRAVLKPNFNNTTRDKIIRSTGNRYLLKVDIAKFYSSIYTHSIPWALHTKPVAKVNRRRGPYFGNALDEDCRKMQDGQTVGLPIGPDTSRIISEIILTAIDTEIKAELGYLQGVRVIDDYHLYFKTHADLEKGRAAVNRALKGYELELNQSKEQLLDLPEVIDREWFNEIREFRFRNKWNHQRKDLITFFDIVVSYSRKFPEDFVLTYALAKLRFTVFSIKNWAILQSLLANALLIEPKILPYVAHNLISYHQKGFPINVAAMTEALAQFIEYHLTLLNDFEVAWALWTAKALGLAMPAELAPVLSANLNPIVVLIALDLHENGLLPGLTKVKWERLLTIQDLYNENWLIAYEGFRLGWLTTQVDHVRLDPFFKLLIDNNVSFYKPDRTLDLSKVKVTSAPQYYEPEDDEDQDESDSVFTAVMPPAPPDPFPDLEIPPGVDGLPF